MSLLVVTFRRPGSAGVFCAGCRRKEAAKYSLVSALFGWWGIPWGPIYTLQAIGNNSSGGYQDAEFNADLLAAVGAELAERGDQADAVRALERSLSMVDQPEVRQFLWILEGRADEDPPIRSQAVAAPTPVSAPSLDPIRAVSSSSSAQLFSPGDLVFWSSSTPLYAQPSDESDVIVSLESGDAIVTRVSGGWAEVRAMSGQSGWMSAHALAKST